MTRPIGYYVHHQGAGHWQRARALAGALARPCTLLGTFPENGEARPPLVALPEDRLSEAPGSAQGFDGMDGEADRPAGLHYAPLRAPRIRDRMGRIAAWIAAADPVLMVVDVSVEVVLLARLMSVPTLVVRLAGRRTDPPHLEAFRSATRLLAPFPAGLEAEATPDWIRRKTLYAGFLTADPNAAVSSPEDGSIAVVLGRGGRTAQVADLAGAGRAVPDRTWNVLGDLVGDTSLLPANMIAHGWVDRVEDFVEPAALVVGGGGDGVVAAVAARGKRFLCLPEPRPFEEQTLKAEALERLGAAVVHRGWPQAKAWGPLVRRGLALDPGRIAGLHAPGALRRTAAAVDRLADTLAALPPRA